MSTYRVVLKRTVITTEYLVVQADNEDDAVENASSGYYPVISQDDNENLVETIEVEEMQ